MSIPEGADLNARILELLRLLGFHVDPPHGQEGHRILAEGTEDDGSGMDGFGGVKYIYGTGRSCAA